MSSELEELEWRYAALLSFVDVEQRSRKNQKIPPTFHVLYVSLIELYPDLLEGEPCKVFMWQMRENAGWIAKANATRFFQDMVAVGAFLSYEPCGDTDSDRWEMWVVPDPETFPYPETFDLMSTDRRKRAREAEKERQKRRVLLAQCEMCGSTNIEYSLTPRCVTCGHEYPTEVLKVNQITVTTDDEMSKIFGGNEE